MNKFFTIILIISLFFITANKVNAANNWDPTDPLLGQNPSGGGSAIGMIGNNSNDSCNITVYTNQQVAVANCGGSSRVILVSTGKKAYSWDQAGYIIATVDFSKGTIVDNNGNNRRQNGKVLKTNSWAPLYGGVYTPGYIRIYDAILFHSVPYYSQSRDNIEVEEYNKLGTKASAGCVRMALKDLIWLYNHVPNKMTVKMTRIENYNGTIPSRVKMGEKENNENNDVNDWPYDGKCICVNAAGYGSTTYNISEYKYKTCKQVCKSKNMILSGQTGNVPPDDFDYDENLNHDDNSVCSCVTATGRTVDFKGSEYKGYSCERFCEIKGYSYSGQNENTTSDNYVDIGEYNIPIDPLSCREIIGDNVYNLLNIGITIFQAGCVIFALVKGMLILVPPIISKDANALQKSFGQLVLFGFVLLAALLFRPIISFIGHLADFDTTCITKIFIGYFL